MAGCHAFFITGEKFMEKVINQEDNFALLI